MFCSSSSKNGEFYTVEFATSESHVKRFMLLSCNDQKRWSDDFWNLVMFLKMYTNFQKPPFFLSQTSKKNTYVHFQHDPWKRPLISRKSPFRRMCFGEVFNVNLLSTLRWLEPTGRATIKARERLWRCVFCFKKETHKKNNLFDYTIYHTIYSVLPWVV